jgi:23S rRNA maturation mini-RNase III
VRNIKDKREINSGYHYFIKAIKSLKIGDYEDSYHNFKIAAKHYRQGFVYPGKKVFQCEYNALKILWYLVAKRKRLDLHRLYRCEAERFFEEWSEKRIKNRLRNYKSALIKRNLAFCNFKISTAIEWLKKPEHERDLDFIANCWKLAAMSLESLRNLNFKFKGQYKIYRLLSNYHKYQGFKYLQDEMIKVLGPIESLSKAEENFKYSVQFVEQTLSESTPIFVKIHHLYMKFWKNITSERIHFIRFMESGDEKEYNVAFDSWKNAIEVARQLIEIIGEEAIFPNRFYSFTDLELEGKYLEASYALRNKRWDDCVSYLEEWCKKFPPEFYFSWRFIQIYIRFLIARAFQVIESIQVQSTCKEELRRILQNLDTIMREEPIGKSTRDLCEYTRGLLNPERVAQKGFLITQEEILPIFKLFPLDSIKEADQLDYISDRELEKLNPLLSLPDEIYNWIDRTSKISSSIEKMEIEEFKLRLCGAIEAFLGYLADYYFQRFNKTETSDIFKVKIIKHNLPELVDLVYDIIYPHFKQREEIRYAFVNLKAGVEQLLSSSDVNLYLKAYDKIHKSISTLTKIFPVIVNISAEYSSDELPIIETFPEWLLIKPEICLSQKHSIVVATVDWPLKYYRKGREKIFISTPSEVQLYSGRYYLHPDWRKGNRIFYPVKEDTPLIPVSFKPEWSFWTSKVASIFIMLQRKQTVFVLGKYGETIQEQEFYLKELEDVRDYLRKKGYNAFLVKEMPEFSHLLNHKEELCMLASRFSIWIYRSPSWAINEYRFAREERIPLIILSPKGVADELKRQIKGPPPISWIEVFEFDKSPFEVIDNAIEWIEKLLCK